MFEDVEKGYVEGEKPVVFRYSREHRLEHAPQIVKDYYAGKMNPVKGFKVLWVNKQNRIILISLFFFVAFIWMYTAFNKTRGYAKINDTVFELESFSYAEEIYTSLKIKNKKADENSNPLKIEAEFFLINGDNQIVGRSQQTLVYRDGEEFLRTKNTDYDIIRVDVNVKCGEVQKELSAQVRRQ